MLRRSILSSLAAVTILAAAAVLAPTAAAVPLTASPPVEASTTNPFAACPPGPHHSILDCHRDVVP